MSVVRLADRLPDELAGAGALTPLLADPSVTDVLVNGAEVWVDRGAGLVRAGTRVGGPDQVRRLAHRPSPAAGRGLDQGCPLLDAPAPGGSPLHPLRPPIAVDGP